MINSILVKMGQERKMDFDFTTESISPNSTTLFSVSSVGALTLPVGTTAQRPGTATAGALRWNTSLSTPAIEFYNGTSWATVSSGGTVTSVAVSGGTTGLTTSGGPVTGSGTITLAGTLAIANGGTGQTSASAAFNALSPLTTIGDILYANGANTSARLPGNTSTTTQFLAQTGNGATSSAPIWTPIGAASFSVNVGPSGTVAWVADTGGYYTATVTHSLGTQNVVVSLAEVSTNQIVQPDLITITSASVVTVRVFGNTKTLRVTVLANGASIAAGASTPSSVIVQNNGVALSGTYTTLNLVGAIAATGASGVATVSAIRTLSYYATSLDSPNNADWVINALAPTVADPTNAAINVRQFSNTIEQGVGLLLTIPATATTIQFTYRGRPQTAPVAAVNIQMNLYYRSIPNNAAISAWSAAKTFTSVGVTTNVFTQYYTYSATLASLGLTAGVEYQFELTRNTTVASNLASNWLMSSLDISFA
jgi:hypothetical protein